MTKTPLEEFLEALIAAEDDEIEFIFLPEPSRADKIKACWTQAVFDMPENAVAVPDGGLVLSYPDPDDIGRIEFYLMNYGGKRVVECEGVVVCHILT